jgi:polysaccharide biosynthesis transport protein
MSRNFELLQQIGKENDIFAVPPAEREREPETLVETPLPVESRVAPAEATSSPAALDKPGIEEVRTLVQRVFLLPSGHAPRVVVFAGTEAGNGCSWICARTAEALACQVTGTVCLVDANLRSPGLHQQFDIPNHHGLSDALLKNEPMNSFVTGLTPPNLSLLSCGASAEAAQALLASNRMRGRLRELRSMFDYVLVDASAMNASNDAIVLGAVSDGAILVLRANASRKETARNALRELQTANVKILGAVLNERTFPIPEAIYNKL